MRLIWNVKMSEQDPSQILKMILQFLFFKAKMRQRLNVLSLTHFENSRRTKPLLEIEIYDGGRTAMGV